MKGGLLLNRTRQVPAEDSAAFAGIAERFRRAGDLDRAITLCRDGLKRFPTLLSARVTLGWALLDKGQYDEARRELEQVLRRAPDNLAAIRGLAELHDRSEHIAPITDPASWHQPTPTLRDAEPPLHPFVPDAGDSERGATVSSTLPSLDEPIRLPFFDVMAPADAPVELETAASALFEPASLEVEFPTDDSSLTSLHVEPETGDTTAVAGYAGPARRDPEAAPVPELVLEPVELGEPSTDVQEEAVLELPAAEDLELATLASAFQGEAVDEPVAFTESAAPRETAASPIFAFDPVADFLSEERAVLDAAPAPSTEPFLEVAAPPTHVFDVSRDVPEPVLDLGPALIAEPHRTPAPAFLDLGVVAFDDGLTLAPETAARVDAPEPPRRERTDRFATVAALERFYRQANARRLEVDARSVA